MIACTTDTQPVRIREEFGNHQPEEAENPAVADPDPANPDAAPENPAQKRRRKGGRPSATGAGKGVGGVVDPAHIVDLKTLPSSSPLQDVALQGRGQVGLQLQVCVGQKAFVVNKADKEIKISVCMLLCGFGKGSLITTATFRVSSMGRNATTC